MRREIRLRWGLTSSPYGLYRTRRLTGDEESLTSQHGFDLQGTLPAVAASAAMAESARSALSDKITERNYETVIKFNWQDTCLGNWEFLAFGSLGDAGFFRWVVVLNPLSQ